MARISGKNARIYIGLASATAAAEPAINQTSFNIDQAVDQLEVTAMGDTSKTYVVGLPDAKISFEAFYDDTAAFLYTAANDGIARRFYLYPTTANTGRYWFGTAFVSVSTSAGVGDAVKATGQLVPNTSVGIVGIS